MMYLFISNASCVQYVSKRLCIVRQAGKHPRESSGVKNVLISTGFVVFVKTNSVKLRWEFDSLAVARTGVMKVVNMIIWYCSII